MDPKIMAGRSGHRCQASRIGRTGWTGRTSRTGRTRQLAIATACVLLGCGQAAAQTMGESKGTITGAAGGGNTDGRNSQLERCDETLGTLGLQEDSSAAWYGQLRQHPYNLMVRALRHYRAQTVQGGLGSGGRLGVQGGTTPASRQVEAQR